MQVMVAAAAQGTFNASLSIHVMLQQLCLGMVTV
jgi:hypothetical protein